MIFIISIVRFREDVFKPGEIGGYCTLNKTLLQLHGQHKSPLQSWFAELEEYTGLDYNPITTGHCDEIVSTPTVFIKLDAGKICIFIHVVVNYCTILCRNKPLSSLL